MITRPALSRRHFSRRLRGADEVVPHQLGCPPPLDARQHSLGLAAQVDDPVAAWQVHYVIDDAQITGERPCTLIA